MKPLTARVHDSGFAHSHDTWNSMGTWSGDNRIYYALSCDRFDTGGRLFRATSYSAVSAGTLLNQMQYAYNGLGQPTIEYQAVSGAVSTSSSPNEYAYV